MINVSLAVTFPHNAFHLVWLSHISVILSLSIYPPLSIAVCRTYQAVKLLYCFGIFITFALQFYVPAEILIPPVVARVSERWERPVDLLLRTILVIFTCKYKPENLASFHLPSGLAESSRKPGESNHALVST